MYRVKTLERMVHHARWFGLPLAVLLLLLLPLLLGSRARLGCLRLDVLCYSTHLGCHTNLWPRMAYQRHVGKQNLAQRRTGNTHRYMTQPFWLIAHSISNTSKLGLRPHYLTTSIRSCRTAGAGLGPAKRIAHVDTQGFANSSCWHLVAGALAFHTDGITSRHERTG